MKYLEHQLRIRLRQRHPDRCYDFSNPQDAVTNRFPLEFYQFFTRIL